MFRWYAELNPQHMLPGSAACALGTTRPVSDEQISKPAPGEAATTA